jgi:hypothetical protein
MRKEKLVGKISIIFSFFTALFLFLFKLFLFELFFLAIGKVEEVEVE